MALLVPAATSFACSSTQCVSGAVSTKTASASSRPIILAHSCKYLLPSLFDAIPGFDEVFRDRVSHSRQVTVANIRVGPSQHPIFRLLSAALSDHYQQFNIKHFLDSDSALAILSVSVLKLNPLLHRSEMSLYQLDPSPTVDDDASTVNGGAVTPPETVADTPEDLDPVKSPKSSVPWPGNSYIIRSAISGHVLTLIEGQVILAPPGMLLRLLLRSSTVPGNYL